MVGGVWSGLLESAPAQVVYQLGFLSFPGKPAFPANALLVPEKLKFKNPVCRETINTTRATKDVTKTPNRNSEETCLLILLVLATKSHSRGTITLLSRSC